MFSRLFLSAVMILCSFPVTLFAFGSDDSSDDSAKDFSAYKKYLMDNFRDFPTSGPGYEESRSLAGSRNSGSLGKNPYMKMYDYPEGDSRNFVKKTIMQDVGTLAQGLAQTAGSALAFQNALTLQQQASQLKATGDPQLQQQAQLLNQEAQQLQTGDTAGAVSTANQVSQVQQPYVSPSYVPTPQQSAFLSGLGSIFGGILDASIAVIGTVLTGNLLKSLGLAGGALSSVPSAVGNTGSQLAQGQQAGNVATNNSLGVVSAVGNSGANSLNNSVQSTQQLSGNNSGGGAPAAK